MTINSQSYSDQFTRLEQISQQLSRNDLVDIDQLLPLVDEAMASYQFCLSRLTAVEQLLNEKLQQAPQEAVVTTMPKAVVESPSDLPF
jgi:exodeoxyribonuclease VII small subunit